MSALDELQTLSGYFTGLGDKEFSERVGDIRAMVAELLAADEEYDAAWEDKNMKHQLNRNGGWNHSVSDRNASILRIQAAYKRRAAAIRAMRDES